jgi:hypothetical protein
MAGFGQLKVVMNDGDQFNVDMSPTVIVAAERHYGKGFSKLVGEEGTLEAMFWIAWKATHCAGRVVEPFDEWLAKVSEVTNADPVSVPLGEA